jgi:hypothetical protein
MANYKILGQEAPIAETITELYSVDQSVAGAVISNIIICNRGTSAATFRIAALPASAVLSDQHYICFNTAISAKDLISLNLGVSLGPSESIQIYSSNDNLSFSAFGVEL